MPGNYISQSFVGGLKSTIKPFLKAFKPISVTESISYNRLQEESLVAAKNAMSANNNVYKPPLLPKPQMKPINAAILRYKSRQFKYIPAEVRADKLAKGLCFYCDQKYEKSHKCKFKK